ncbi:MAG: DUF2284 domain-containing protein [Proteobacteria bacterium]|nr:DUF2284 domain-containing protein [Pseudomonadota bacterium]
MGTAHLNPSPEEKKFQVEIKELEGVSGSPLYYEQYEATISISSIVHGKKYREACEECHEFGKNLACPPYSPDFRGYVDDQKYARVICIRIPQERFGKHEIQENMDKECFIKARSILVKELLRHRKQGYVVAGSGSCLSCDLCVVAEGSRACKNPEKRIYSLESLGVDVSALTKTCFDFDLEWSTKEYATGFICSIGAVFMHKKEEIG